MEEIAQEHKDIKLEQLAKMAYHRNHVSVPDVYTEWDKFCHVHIEEPQKQKRRTLLMWGAALSGAAAMFVGFFIYISFFYSSYNLVALQYDDTPQLITLSLDDEIQDLSNIDSISFLSSATTADNRIIHDAHSAKEEKLQCLSTPRGMDFKLILQDGTEVWLNAESSIEFPATFLGGDRKVSLRGEAYFKVAHNEEKPFIINLGDKFVHVLGTEFNVRNYASENTQVALVNGSIRLYDENDENKIVLQPGQNAIWDENGKIHIQDIDTYNITQWIDGFFYFDEQPLGLILREVGRWYNYGVVFKNKSRMDYILHFSALRNDSIERVIDDLNTICGFKLSVENKNIVVY